MNLTFDLHLAWCPDIVPIHFRFEKTQVKAFREQEYRKLYSIDVNFKIVLIYIDLMIFSFFAVTKMAWFK